MHTPDLSDLILRKISKDFPLASIGGEALPDHGSLRNLGCPERSLRAVAILLILASGNAILRRLVWVLQVLPKEPRVVQPGYVASDIAASLFTAIAMFVLFRMVRCWESDGLVARRRAILFLVVASAVPLSEAAYRLGRPLFWGPSLLQILGSAPLAMLTYLALLLGGLLLLDSARRLGRCEREELVLSEIAPVGARSFGLALFSLSIAAITIRLTNMAMTLSYSLEVPGLCHMPAWAVGAAAGASLTLASANLVRRPGSYAERGFLRLAGLSCALWGVSILLMAGASAVTIVYFDRLSGFAPPLLDLLTIAVAGLKGVLFAVLGANLFKGTVPRR